MPQLPPAVDHTGIFLCIFPQPPRIILFFISSFTISRHNPLYKHCPSSRTPITIATHALRPGSSCCRCVPPRTSSLSKHLRCPLLLAPAMPYLLQCHACPIPAPAPAAPTPMPSHPCTLHASPLPPLACSHLAILAPMSRLPHTCPCACRTFQPPAKRKPAAFLSQMPSRLHTSSRRSPNSHSSLFLFARPQDGGACPQATTPLR